MTSRFRSYLYNEQAAAKRLEVATVAMSCDRDPTVNRARLTCTVDTIMQSHPDTELVIFGEMILGWYKPGTMPEYHRRIAEPTSRENLREFISLAVQYGIYLSFGVCEIDDEIMYNSQVLLNPQGEIQAVHRKWNLKEKEKKANFQAGSAPITITDIRGVRTVIIICSDAKNPHVIRELMRNRPDLIILSLADDKDEEMFMSRLLARLYDAWIVTANRYGDEDGVSWNGHLVVSDPYGELRWTGRDKEQFLVCEPGFPDKGTWLKRVIRNVWVKTPLVFHILRNWRRLSSYY